MKEKKLGLWEAVSMAVGTMIGAGIFSILGVGTQICGSNLPVAFIIAALVSFSVAYSYAKLGSVFVSNAGPIEFIIRGIGDNPITGMLSILMWLSYVISISLFAKAFAGYFLALLHLPLSNLYVTVIEGLVILFFTALNFFGAKAVGKAEFWIVLIKLSILLSFVVLGIWSINPEFIKPVFSEKEIVHTFFAASVLFLTYMGFGLITNASENIQNPEKTVPKAIYISIVIVAFVYVSVALVALGNLGFEGLIKAKEYALAEAAKPFLGSIGFTLVAIGALFSTSSAINATLYGGANIAYVLAKKGHLPEVFERKIWFNEPEGLYITAVLSMLFASMFDLSGISSLISFVFLIIYLFVIVSHYRLIDKAGGNKILIIINFILILSVFITLIVYQWENQKGSFYTGFIIVALALIFEISYRLLTKRKFEKRDYHTKKFSIKLPFL
ncbi:amino acid permease [Persephonella atlantica]|uniref:Amino acid permease n=1 Tax=Persephonella atlantica TaxID=2699429 RepID=A0ABS1GI06_9AQUI|nr:APC family permease [Persephonella atlantica]MBK3332566.1 amino acid permease [Persephonella atlantica]